ncbi:MAG: hypothetical protein ACKORK_11985, partial [Gemmatimonadota bacterium]
MQIESADPVLIDTAIAIVVDPFGIHHVIALAHRDIPHQAPALVRGVLHGVPLAHADELPHLPDETIVVEVLAGIFIEKAVTIIVVGTDGAPVGLRREPIHVGAVRI